jgi:hypothetical protein
MFISVIAATNFLIIKHADKMFLWSSGHELLKVRNSFLQMDIHCFSTEIRISRQTEVLQYLKTAHGYRTSEEEKLNIVMCDPGKRYTFVRVFSIKMKILDILQIKYYGTLSSFNFI